MFTLEPNKQKDCQKNDNVPTSPDNKTLCPETPDSRLSTGSRNSDFSLTNKSAEKSEYKLYCYRYVVLLAYVAIRFTSGAVYGVFVPFSNMMGQVYKIKHVFVVLSCFIFNGLSPAVNLLYANKIIISYGTKISVFFEISI